MRIRIRCLLASTLLLLCSFSSLAFAAELADRTALEAAAQAWIKAFNARDLNALAALSTPDIALIDTGVSPPVKGREAARGVWEHALAVAPGQLTAATKEAVMSGDIAWRIVAFTDKLPNGDIVSRGHSLEIWKRVSGEWKIHRQTTSLLLSPPDVFVRPNPSKPILDRPQ
jgi:ketosteroid isomerase-like protein